MSFFRDMTEQEAKLLNPLVLAFVGDAVQTLYVRESLVHTSDAKANKLHTRASKQVNATAQSHTVQRIMSELTEDEQEIFRRARNSKINTPAKNAALDDYRKASGFEAVLGYVYLTGQRDRLMFLLDAGNEKEKI